jgi:hypothetical protein
MKSSIICTLSERRVTQCALFQNEELYCVHLQNEELHNLHFSPNGIRVIKSKSILWMEKVERMEEDKLMYF